MNSIEPKYKLIPSDKKNLYQVVALKDFGNLREGDLGGYIEKESNLFQFGNCWVGEDAIVQGNAKVAGNAIVYGNACTSENAKVCGNAIVSGCAKVSGSAIVYGNAIVTGNAKVYEDAIVSGDACIAGSAIVSGDARIFGNAIVGRTSYITCSNDILTTGPLGSRYSVLTACRTEDKNTLEISTGCFSGTLAEFILAVQKTHPADSTYYNQYQKAITYIKSHFDLI